MLQEEGLRVKEPFRGQYVGANMIIEASIAPTQIIGTTIK